jgi:hypothetical protein
MDKSHHLHLNEAAHALLERNLAEFSRPTTFANLLMANPKALGHLADLKWLFPRVCERKEQGTLNDNEKERYICAFQMINNDGTLGKLVDIHAEMHMQHTNARLLPWHRVFLHIFEEGPAQLPP